MTAKFNPNHNTKTLSIPAEIVEKTALKQAGSISVHGTDAALLLTATEMTPMEMAKAIEMFQVAAASLTDRLEDIGDSLAKYFASVDVLLDGINIFFPNELLRAAGFRMKGPLDIHMDQGQIYIEESEPDDADDPLDHVPDFLVDELENRGIANNILSSVLQMEDRFSE